ncbi:uncharacterized protein [Gossypium hirsutum]|uniref:Uncharacterized protein isoform X1 n=1 Tax=Gossypium hirsutum TaxID=3635 RepID=A0ABM2ZEI5_GOSHI|nr:uncharacterized protein LOC121212451 isoform X1 [Gossypium hirsutum]
MKSRGSDYEEEDWDPVVILASLKNAKLDAKAALQLEKAKREVHERLGIGKDKKDKEEASPKDEDNEVGFTVRGSDAVLVLASLATVQVDEKTASELEKMKSECLKGKKDKERPSSDTDGRNDERGLLLLSYQGSIATNAIYRKIKKKQQKASSEMGDEELSRRAVTEHPMP